MSEREGVYPPGPHGCLHSAQSWYIKDGVMGCDDCDGDRSAESARRREVEQAREAIIAAASACHCGHCEYERSVRLAREAKPASGRLCHQCAKQIPACTCEPVPSDLERVTADLLAAVERHRATGSGIADIWPALDAVARALAAPEEKG